MFCHLGLFFFFCLGASVALRGGALGVHRGGVTLGNAGCCAVTLYVGEGPRGRIGTCSTLCRILVTLSATHNQIGPFCCCFPSGWACAHSRPLWVSPTTSPVRLGVSPAAAPTPTGVFNQGLRLYFPALEPWVVQSASLPAVLLVYLCVNVGPRGTTRRSACPALHHSESGPLGLSVRECGAAGSASGQTACPIHPTLHQSQSCHGNASPLCPRLPISAHPTGLDECLFFISLVSDFLVVRFSVSSGCARRRSVSTYAAILVLPSKIFLIEI